MAKVGRPPKPPEPEVATAVANQLSPIEVAALRSALLAIPAVGKLSTSQKSQLCDRVAHDAPYYVSSGGAYAPLPAFSCVGVSIPCAATQPGWLVSIRIIREAIRLASR